MSPYSHLIKDAFKVPLKNALTDQDLRDINECMREDIFHSTLDWQTKAQLQKGARQAWELICILRNRKAA